MENEVNTTEARSTQEHHPIALSSHENTVGNTCPLAHVTFVCLCFAILARLSIQLFPGHHPAFCIYCSGRVSRFCCFASAMLLSELPWSMSMTLSTSPIVFNSHTEQTNKTTKRSICEWSKVRRQTGGYLNLRAIIKSQLHKLHTSPSQLTSTSLSN